MTKADIVSEISRSTGIEKASVLAVVESLMDVIKDNMAKGENVYLRGFGSFVVKERARKVARNISKQTSLVIPAIRSLPSNPATRSRISLQMKNEID